MFVEQPMGAELYTQLPQLSFFTYSIQPTAEFKCGALTRLHDGANFSFQYVGQVTEDWEDGETGENTCDSIQYDNDQCVPVRSKSDTTFHAETE